MSDVATEDVRFRSAPPSRHYAHAQEKIAFKIVPFQLTNHNAGSIRCRTRADHTLHARKYGEANTAEIGHGVCKVADTSVRAVGTVEIQAWRRNGRHSQHQHRKDIT